MNPDNHQENEPVYMTAVRELHADGVVLRVREKDGVPKLYAEPTEAITEETRKLLTPETKAEIVKWMLWDDPCPELDAGVNAHLEYSRACAYALECWDTPREPQENRNHPGKFNRNLPEFKFQCRRVVTRLYESEWRLMLYHDHEDLMKPETGK